MKKKIFCFLVITILLFLIIRGQDAINYAKDSIQLCYEMIIPTLFPFFICSGLLIYSGFCESLSKVFAPFMQPLFGINPSGSAAFILGIISGYPLGAVTVCQLYESSYLSKDEAERLLAFCNNSGPLFILSSVGIGLFSSVKTGVLLYLAHILGAITVGIILKLFLKPVYNPNVGAITTPEKNIGEIFSLALSNAINSILNVCGAVLFFSVISHIVIDYIPEFHFKTLLYGILEFASGNAAIAKSSLNFVEKLILASIVTGFAGFSVHVQVLSVVAHSGLKLRTYLLGKTLHGIFSGLFTLLILIFSDFFIKKAYTLSLGYGFFINSLFICVLIIGLIILMQLLRKHRDHPLKQ